MIYKKFLNELKKEKKFSYIISKKNSYSGKKILDIIVQSTKIFCKKNAYLEIGVFRGNTLINNAINNKSSTCIGVDNFSLFNKSKKNEQIVRNSINKHKLKNVILINSDFEKAIKKIKKKIGVLFIDGPHDYRSHIIALLKYKTLLAEKCLIIVDDANYFHVRKANQDFIDSNKEFSIIFEKYTNSHIANSKNKQNLIDGYWNGINIIGKCKNKKKINFQKNYNLLMKTFPLSHEIFRHYYFFNTIEILDAVYKFNKKEIIEKKFLKIIRNIKIPSKLKKQIKFRSQNIF